MIPAGYLSKKVVINPDWLNSAGITDICSLSSCVSKNFADYINFWKHNGHWLFDSPAVIDAIAREYGIDISGTTLFYYEVYELEFDEHSKVWTTYAPELSFVTDVLAPPEKNLMGFDVVTFYARTSPECSPLSCNYLAHGISVNEHCLFRTLDEAKNALESGFFENSERGPFRIFGVYSLDR
jgi:hypothetical protein